MSIYRISRLFVLGLLPLFVAVTAFADNLLKTDPVIVKFGEQSIIQLALDNQDEITGLQFDLFLPSGISLDVSAVSLNKERTDSHLLDCSQLPNQENGFRFLVYSTENRNLKGKSGNLISLPIAVGKDFKGTHAMTMKNVELTNKASASLPFSLSLGTITGEQGVNTNDVDLLKLIAQNNPDCKDLQTFIQNEGWKNKDLWQDRNQKIAVCWDNSGRISGLRVQKLTGINLLNIAGLDSLVDLQCSDLQLRSLDLKKNTILRNLNVTGNRLSTLDLSGCPKIESVTCILNMDKENNNVRTLQNLVITGCTKIRRLCVPDGLFASLNLTEITALEELELNRNQNLTGLELGNISNLRSFKVERCPKFNLEIDLSAVTALQHLQINYSPVVLKLGNLDRLFSLEIAGTHGYGYLLEKLPPSIYKLDCQNTDYPLPDFSSFQNLREYGVPSHVTELNFSSTKIERLYTNGTKLLSYSKIVLPDKFGLDNWRIEGRTTIELGKRMNEFSCQLLAGDTLDLSAFAADDLGNKCSFQWEDNNRVEPAITEIRPGVFLLPKEVKQGVNYRCKMSHPIYNNWRYETPWIILEQPKMPYDSTEVAALDKIVRDINDKHLADWWNNEEWKNNPNSGDYRFRISWVLDEKTNLQHVNSFEVYNWDESLTEIDVSDLNFMQFFTCSNNKGLAHLVLPDENGLLTDLVCRRNPKLESIDLSRSTRLKSLDVQGSLFSNFDLVGLNNLEKLNCNYTDYSIKMESLPKSLKYYGVPANTESFDMNVLSTLGIDSLKEINPSGSLLKYSTVKLQEGQSWNLDGFAETIMRLEGVRQYKDEYGEICHLIPMNQAIDLSAEVKVGATAEWYAYDSKTDDDIQGLKVTDLDKSGKFIVSGVKPNDEFEAILHNEKFPNWDILVWGKFYTCDGDANLDNEVNVLDISASVNYILKDSAFMLPIHEFGLYQTDVNQDNVWDVADVTGIANLIMTKPILKSNLLRGALNPLVSLSVEDGYLYMDSDVPVTGVQLEFTGTHQAGPLLGEAAKLTQTSRDGDVFRLLAYSLTGESIPTGKNLLMKWPEGATLKLAAFSDAQARSLDVDMGEVNGLPTSNEQIGLDNVKKDVYNYPNPFRGYTTIVYQLAEEVDRVYMEVYSYNGMMVDVIKGLSAHVGTNEFLYSTALSKGSYIYRLVMEKGGVRTYSKSNTFIVK